MNVISYIKGVFNKMFCKNEVESKLGVKIISTNTMQDAINLWKKVYIGNAPWNYSQLGIPSQLCEKLIKTALSELSVTLNNTIYEKLFNETIERLRIELPKALALGGLVLKPYQKEDGYGINLIHADCFFPTKVTSDGKITGALFLSKSRDGKYYITDTELQELEGNVLTITNRRFRSDSDKEIGIEIAIDEGIEPIVVIQNVTYPLFSYFKVPKYNKVDETSPLGESIFSDAIALFEAVDKNNYECDFEFRSKKGYTFIDRDLILKNNMDQDQLPDVEIFIKVDEDEDINKKIQRTTDQTIRVDSFRTRANDIKRSIEFACGVGYGLISDPETVQRTATEIHMGENQNRINNKDLQKAIEKSIDGMLQALSDLIYLTSNQTGVTLNAAYSWGDSILTGSEEQRDSMRQDVQSGILPAWLYLMKNYNMSETEAKLYASEAKEANTFNGMDLGV